MKEMLISLNEIAYRKLLFSFTTFTLEELMFKIRLILPLVSFVYSHKCSLILAYELQNTVC